jgi:hypothetical protein
MAGRADQAGRQSGRQGRQGRPGRQTGGEEQAFRHSRQGRQLG